MNILMVSHYALPHRGGIEIIVDKLSAALAEHMHEVWIVSSSTEWSSRQCFPRRRLLGVKAFDPLKHYGVHYPLFSPALYPILLEAVRWADLVHVQGMLYQSSAVALWLARRSGKPAVLTEHAGLVTYDRAFFNHIQSAAVATIGRLSLSWNNAIIVPDSVVREILVNSIHVDPGKITQIPLGVDSDFFHPVPIDEKNRIRSELGWDERPKVLFVGNFVARKRLRLLFAAISDFFDVVLCGEGTPPSPLPSHVTVYPAMDHDRLVKLYQAADVFVVPSSVETFSIVAYEAMSSGLPVVMTNDLRHLTIAQSELVTFVPANPIALQETILALLHEPARCRQIGLASAEWVRHHFSWRNTVQDHLALYSALLGTA